MRVESRPDPGTIGVADDTAVSEPCLSKSAMGNQVLKAQFGRRRTHNEQTLVRPCGIIYTRATMFGAEAVSNFLVRIYFVIMILFIEYLAACIIGHGAECIFCT